MFSILIRHFHHSFLYLFKYCLLFLEHIYKGIFDIFVKSGIWAVSHTVFVVCFPTACLHLRGYSFLFLCMSYNFFAENWITLLADSPLPLGPVFVVCLFVYLITWIDYFSQFYILHSGKLLILFLQPWVYVLVTLGLLFLISVKQWSPFVITTRYWAPLIAR